MACNYRTSRNNRKGLNMKQILNRLLQPVLSNIPLFVISILLMGGFDVGYQQYLFHENTSIGIATAYTEIIFMAFLICLFSYLCRKIYLKIVFYIILFILYGLSCYLLYAYSAYITPNILLLLFETNTKEATGFFETYLATPAMFKSVAIVGFLLILTIIGERFNNRIKAFATRPFFIWLISVVLLFGIIGGIGAVKRYWDLIQCKKAYDAECWKSSYLFYKVMPVSNFCYSMTAIHLAGQDLYYMINATKERLSTVKPVGNDSLNIVLVIGESFNKYHASLYGYELNTTPFQCEEQSRGNLYAFTNVKAPHNMTSIVLKNMFCCNDVHEGERWHDYAFFPAIFKKAGYDVWLWDNQYQTNPNMAYNFTLNSIIFNNEIKELSYTDYNEQCTTYDKELITDFFQKKGQGLGPHNLIIFHLNGQHRPANSQYPPGKEYQLFSAKDIKNPASYLNDESRQRIAEYDNATFYNDQVIRHITDFIKDKNALLIYFSDHGEEVYDYRDFLGRSLLEETEITPELIKYQMEIPFIVWCSDKWKKQHEREWKTIGESISREFSIDNTCHFLFNLGGIHTKEYNPKRDLFSPEFVPQTKEYDMTNVF